MRDYGHWVIHRPGLILDDLSDARPATVWEQLNIELWYRLPPITIFDRSGHDPGDEDRR